MRIWSEWTGFVVACLESGGDPFIAGQYGAISASFTLAQVGVPRLGPEACSLAEIRLQQLLPS